VFVEAVGWGPGVLGSCDQAEDRETAGKLITEYLTGVEGSKFIVGGLKVDLVPKFDVLHKVRGVHLVRLIIIS
jgi:hypothetical protein